MNSRVDTTAAESYRWPPLYAERVALLPIAFAILALWIQVPFALPVALLGVTVSWAATYVVASRRREAILEAESDE